MDSGLFLIRLEFVKDEINYMILIGFGCFNNKYGWIGNFVFYGIPGLQDFNLRIEKSHTQHAHTTLTHTTAHTLTHTQTYIQIKSSQQ